MTTLVIATRNAHKVQEIQAILSGSIRFLSLKDFPGAPEIIEDAPTFSGNAIRKAAGLAEWLAASQPSTLNSPLSTRFVLSDDSGLEVDALNGAPGVHSARFAALHGLGPPDSAASSNSSDAANNEKLLRLLKDVPREKRTARFRCVLALAEINPQSAIRNSQLFEGACEGRISFAPSGQGGFGYDPLFIPDGYVESFAELSEDVKNKISHRSKALARLRLRLLPS